VTERSGDSSTAKQMSDLPAELLQELHPEVASALVKWQSDRKTTVVFDRWLTPGKSSAQVAAIALSGQVSTRRVVMKVCPPGQATGREPRLHLAALENAPKEFAERHLVKQPIDPIPVRGGWWIMFQEVAGGSTRSVRALSTLHGRRQLPDLAASIVSSILTDWNPAPDVKSTRPVEFLFEHLGNRLVDGGPFDQLVSELTYTPANQEQPRWILTPRGRIVPNIAAWLRDHDWVQQDVDHLLVLYGNSHGDLHPDNVLLSMIPQPEADTYQLIDLSSYSSAGPLTRDPVHLLLSCIIREVAEMTELQRRAVSDFLVDPTMDAPEQLQVVGVCNLASDIVEAGERFAEQFDMLDDWQDMHLLSLAGNALLFAMRPIDSTIRYWSYLLACTALGKFLSTHDVPTPIIDGPLLSIGAAPVNMADTAQAIELLYEACGRWSGSCANIAIVDSSILDADSCGRLVRMGWDLVVEMNPQTDVNGCWASATSNDERVHRLRLPGQDLMFGRNSTLWIAAAGLSDVEPVNPSEDLRRWRARYLRFVNEAFEALARHTAKAVTVTCFGFPVRAPLAVAEASVDVFGDRVRLVVVSDAGVGDLADYGAEPLLSDPNPLLHAILPVPSVGDISRRPTLPSAEGPMPIPDEVISRFTDTAQLLHSEIGVQDDSVEGASGAFYRGRPISWFELDLDLDVPRKVTDELLVRVTDALEQRDTLRIMLGHSPGAGGTTVARRIAWRIKDTYPTVVVRGISDDVVLAEAVADLAQLSGTPVLLVVELVPESTLDRLFSVLRAGSIPTVLLITARRTSPAYRQAGETSESSALEASPAGQRGLRLGPMAKRDERVEMARRFADMVPGREDALFALTGASLSTNVPFFYALTAFAEEFEGLPDYVMQFLIDLNSEQRELLTLTALIHRFSGVAVPVELYASLLHISLSNPIQLEKYVDDSFLDLLTEEEPGTWRMTHSLVAEEVLRQLLTPAGRLSSSDDWKAALPAWSLRLIERARAAYGRYLPEDMKMILVLQSRFHGELPLT
jgi:hypothetical protein